MAAAGRAAAWLLPAGRRDWIAAVWAEAHDVPPGLERLAWRAGGVWMLAREALMPRRIVRTALFAVAAAGAAWSAWPDSSVPRPSPRPPAAASPMPRNASPSFHDRGQFGAHSTGFWP
jgi:hypothetical protein